MADLTDAALHALLEEDAERGWRAFVDQFTTAIVALIERAGVADRDEVADVYVRVCERLAADGCERLRRHDPRKGALAAWLTIVIRHVVVDWARSERGRRRLFGAIARLDERHQRVFELYYWEHRRPSEIVEMLTRTLGQAVGLADVLDALATIERSLSDRHRRELLALVARTRTPVSLDDEDERPRLALVDRQPHPEAALRVREIDEAFAGAMAELPAEDRAIVKLKFVQGWAGSEIQRALHLDALPPERIGSIVAMLRERLAARGIGHAEAATPGLKFLTEDPS